jgi:hypothetical protein
MMPAKDFMLLMGAERKLDKHQSLNAEERRIVDTYGRFEKKLCGCGCGELLEPRVDGERHQIDGKEVNSDCYFTAFGDELEKYLIGGRGIRRSGAH